MACEGTVLLLATLGELLRLVPHGRSTLEVYLHVTRFRPAKCVYLRKTDRGKTACHRCWNKEGGLVCKSSWFHCVEIEVAYQDMEGYNQTGRLYRDPFTLTHHRDRQHCSVSICRDKEVQNDQEVAGFVGHWRTAGTLPCFYNPTDPEQILAGFGGIYSNLILSVVIPSTLFLLPVTYLGYWYCYGYGYRGSELERVAQR